MRRQVFGPSKSQATCGKGRFQCRFDAGSWFGCSSGASYSNSGFLTRRAHVLVRAVDPSGRSDGSPASQQWVVDRQAPETFATSGPQARTRSGAAVLSFHLTQEAGDNTGSPECRPGRRRLRSVRLAGELLGVGPARTRSRSARRTPTATSTRRRRSGRWFVDQTAPQSLLDSGPSGVTSSTDATFAFSLQHEPGDAGGGFECQLDSVSWSPCPHRRATQSARGCTCSGCGLSTASATSTPVRPNGSGRSTSDRRHRAHAGRPGRRRHDRRHLGDLRLQLRAGCQLPVQGRQRRLRRLLGPGQRPQHECAGTWPAHVRARAIDAIGNIDLDRASRSWNVDTEPPDTAISAGPADGSTITSSSTSFGFLSEAGTRFECKIDASPFGPCSGAQSHALSGQTNGNHSFQVRAIDGVANVDASPAGRSFKVAGSMTVAASGFQVTWKQSRLKAGTVLISGSLAGSEPADLTIGLSQPSRRGRAGPAEGACQSGPVRATLPLPASARSGPGLLVPASTRSRSAGPPRARASALTSSPPCSPSSEGVVAAGKIVASKRKVTATFKFAPKGCRRRS